MSVEKSSVRLAATMIAFLSLRIVVNAFGGHKGRTARSRNI